MMETGETEIGGQEAAPLDMLSALFEARGWDTERESDEEVCAEVKGNWTRYQLRAIWREEDHVLQLLALPDVSVSDDKYASMYETLGLINEQLWLGHFDMWSNNGMLLYRHGLMLPGNGMLELDQAQLLVETALAECDRFYPVFQFILWGDKSPKDALAAALIDTMGEA